MKLQFKQQPYQTDATMAVVRCFEGQSHGFRKEVVSRTIDTHALPGMEVKVEEIFSNKKLEITKADILKNVQALQKEPCIIILIAKKKYSILLLKKELKYCKVK